MKAQSISRLKQNLPQEETVSTTTTEDTDLITGAKMSTKDWECVLADTKSGNSIPADTSPKSCHNESPSSAMTPRSDQSNSEQFLLNQVKAEGQDMLQEALEYCLGVTQPKKDLNLLKDISGAESFDSQVDNFLYTPFIE